MISRSLIIILLFGLFSCEKGNEVIGTVSDIEGNEYRTVMIGNQTWMAENLRVIKYSDGTPMESAERFSASKPVYGLLYSSLIIKNPGVCPVGWHISTEKDWSELSEYLGGDEMSGASLKEEGTVNWTPPNAGTTNGSGFSALPAGAMIYAVVWIGNYNVRYDTIPVLEGNLGFWWMISDYQISKFVALSYQETRLIRDFTLPEHKWLSIRCVKNR